ncbi:MAG: M20/M25/M40 family metallo-hydrolase [Bacteroidales bacterium]|jgi:carboxypeptidase Q|nr:M20/M25/M40 family metallo-hydrolase [Bacteroidales bacterium]
MNRFITILAVALLFILNSSALAQSNKVVKKIIEIGQTDNQTMKHLDILTNRFGGRLIGSDAYENAADWAAHKFKEWGMQVKMDYAGEIPVGFNRGPWFGRMLSHNGMHLHFATPSYTSGTKGVQKGHVLIEPKTQAQFDRMKGRLKGAWVLISGKNTGWPIDFSAKADHIRDSIISVNIDIEKQNREIRSFNRANKDSLQKEMLPYIEEPALFYSQMKDAGILGIIQSAANPIRVLYDRKNINDMTFETLPTVPDIKLDEHQYALIEQMTKERQSFELEFDIRNHFKMGPIKYYNVIGIIPGTEFPDEYVMMGGHLDAFDVATGGVDDGSGVTPHMEAARLIMKAGGKPKRTILVCLWAGEEFGLLGSKAWVENNKDKWGRISNYFNRDGGPTVANNLRVPAAMFKDIEKIVEPLNSINPDFPFTLTERKASKKPTRAGGSDHAYFALNGIPAISLGTSDPKGYDFNYGEIWHTERDMYNKSIPEYQEHTAIVTAIVVFGIANLDHILSREGYYIDDEK